jgi:hypothetical protein
MFHPQSEHPMQAKRHEGCELTPSIYYVIKGFRRRTPIITKGEPPMNKSCGILSQLLQLFSRAEFQQAVEGMQPERHARGLTCLGQFVAMLFC